MDEALKYYPYGNCRNSQGDLGTDKLFTGQRLDDTGLYYYNARYYDPQIGRFISADSIVPSIMNPQSLNRYSYVLNNPLRYNDPTGQWPNWGAIISSVTSVVTSVTSSVTGTVTSAWSSFASSVTSAWSSLTGGISETSLPIEQKDAIRSEEPGSNDTYNLEWGCEASGGIIYQYYEATSVVSTEEGDYYLVNTTGHGISTGASVSFGISEPETTDFRTSETWGVDLKGTMVAMFDFEPSVRLRIDNTGVSVSPKDSAYLAFSAPEISLVVTRTTMSRIDESNIYDYMPSWARNAYDRQSGN